MHWRVLLLSGIGLLLTSCGTDMTDACGGYGFAAPDFNLRLRKGHDDLVIVPQGGETSISVCVDRFGLYDKPIEVSISGAPKGVTADPARISSGSFHTKLVLRAAPDLAVVDHRTVTVHGDAPDVGHTFPIEIEVRGRPGALDGSWGTTGRSDFDVHGLDAIVDAQVDGDPARLTVVGNRWDDAGPHVFVEHTYDGEPGDEAIVDGMLAAVAGFEAFGHVRIAGMSDSDSGTRFALTEDYGDGSGPFARSVLEAPAPLHAVPVLGVWYASTADPSAQLLQIGPNLSVTASAPFGADGVTTALWYDSFLFAAVLRGNGHSEIDRFDSTGIIFGDPLADIPGRIDHATPAPPFLYLSGVDTAGEDFLLRLRDGEPDGTFGLGGWLPAGTYRFGPVVPKNDGSVLVVFQHGDACTVQHLDPRGRRLHDFGPAQRCGEHPALVRANDGRVLLIGEDVPGYFVERFWDERVPPPAGDP